MFLFFQILQHKLTKLKTTTKANISMWKTHFNSLQNKKIGFLPIFHTSFMGKFRESRRLEQSWRWQKRRQRYASWRSIFKNKTKTNIKKISFLFFLQKLTLFWEISRTWAYDVAMVSNNPDLTKSNSSAPLTRFLSWTVVNPFPVCSSMTEVMFFPMSSSKRLVIRPKRECCKFFNHSKYETVTPPAFAKMSGMMTTPRSDKILSVLKEMKRENG